MAKRDIDHTSPLSVRMDKHSQTRNVSGLVNARLLGLAFDSFEVPSDSDLKKLRPGDFVKLSRNGERFWVKLSGYVGRKWHGKIANRLIQNDDLSLGDSIYFMKRNIHDFLKRS